LGFVEHEGSREFAKPAQVGLAAENGYFQALVRLVKAQAA
jgi:hypothetical protein